MCHLSLRVFGPVRVCLGESITTAFFAVAKAFPKSQFCGFDLHPTSIEAANRHAKEQQITNVNFSIATAKDFPGNDYGFVAPETGRWEAMEKTGSPH
jgi:hypothetical protein